MFFLRLGVWLGQTQPVPVLKHGRKAVRLVRHRAQHLVDAQHWKPERLRTFLELVIRQIVQVALRDSAIQPFPEV